MSKHKILNDNEMRDYKISKEVIRYLKLTEKILKLKKGEINILDYGCGRGRDVSVLRKMGYNAFGVDIDPEPIENSREYYLSIGLDRKLLSFPYSQ